MVKQEEKGSLIIYDGDITHTLVCYRSNRIVLINDAKLNV